MRIILSSASPRRRELLGFIFDSFEIKPYDGPEQADFTTPGEYVMALSRDKAAGSAGIKSRIADDIPSVLSLSAGFDGRNEYNNGENGFSADEELSIYIGSDTIVYADGSVLGKPADREDAYRMLSALSGRSHKVFTGVCLLAVSDKTSDPSGASPGPVACRSFYCETDVYVSPLSDSEIERYIDSGEPMDKAGAYGIQSLFSKHIERIDGDYFNVVGLPVSMLYDELKKMMPGADI